MNMKLAIFTLTALLLAPLAAPQAATPPDDIRLRPLKDLNGYFPFTPPRSRAEWDTRADYVRRQVLVSQGLRPMPTKTPLGAVIHGKIQRPHETLDRAYFERAP